MTDYLGNTTTYTYNARGAVTAIGEKYSGTSTTYTTKYAYNADGSLQKVTYPLSSYMTSTYAYDYAGRVSSITNKRQINLIIYLGTRNINSENF